MKNYFLLTFMFFMISINIELKSAYDYENLKKNPFILTIKNRDDLYYYKILEYIPVDIRNITMKYLKVSHNDPEELFPEICFCANCEVESISIAIANERLSKKQENEIKYILNSINFIKINALKYPVDVHFFYYKK